LQPTGYPYNVQQLIVLTRHAGNHASSRFRTARPGLRVLLLDPFELELRLNSGHPAVLAGEHQLDCRTSTLVPRIGSLAPEYSLSVLEYLCNAGARSLNPLAGLLRLRHKFTMLGVLAAAGLPVPDSALLRATADFETAVQGLGGYPVVMKFVRGGQGVGVIKAPDGDTVRSVLEALNLLQYDVLLQRYLPGAAQSDLRVLVLGGRARWAIRRSSSAGRFRSNFHRGGSVVPAEIDPEAGQLAERAAAAFDLGLAGVDIAEDEGRRYILEVNGSPGFEATEQAHGADIAGAILDYAATL
jgi:ribosomal protein S6--L-glutamate ligase